jgi:hypothetical protein
MAIFKKENGQLVDFSNPIPDTSIAPIENGATSTHNYVVGAYALLKGILKKVTNAISIGTAFSDSNSETTDVATELKELNDDVTTINTQLLINTPIKSYTLGDAVYRSTDYEDLTQRTVTIPSDGYYQLTIHNNFGYDTIGEFDPTLIGLINGISQPKLNMYYTVNVDIGQGAYAQARAAVINIRSTTQWKLKQGDTITFASGTRRHLGWFSVYKLNGIS